MSFFGGATSSNVASSVANVTNSISSSTLCQSTQAQIMKQAVVLRNCNITAAGNFDVSLVAHAKAKSSQIVTAVQTTEVRNKIAQNLTQVAKAITEFGAIGPANASNAASMLSNATNTISQDVAAVSGQYAASDQSFTCDNSVIKANNVSIALATSLDFLSEQVLKQTQTATLVNDVSQTLKQEAVAEATGLASILGQAALMMAIWVLGGALVCSKVLGKLLLFLLLIIPVGLLALIGISKLLKLPPLFAEPIPCIMGRPRAGDAPLCVAPDANGKKTAEEPPAPAVEYPIRQPTPRYLFSILPTGVGSVNLLQMVLSKVGDGRNNGGYNLGVLNYIEQYFVTFYETRLAPVLVGTVHFDDHDVEVASLFPAGKCKIPNLLVAPGRRVGIPVEFLTTNLGTGTAQPGGPVPGSCTPSVVTWVSGQFVSTCPQFQPPIDLQAPADDELCLASVNITGWLAFLDSADGNTRQFRSGVARFVLAHFLGLDCTVYRFDSDIVTYSHPETKKETWAFAKVAEQIPSSSVHRMVGSDAEGGDPTLPPRGTMSLSVSASKVGFYDTPAYQLHCTLVKHNVVPIIVVTLLVVLALEMVYVFYRLRTDKSANTTTANTVNTSRTHSTVGHK